MKRIEKKLKILKKRREAEKPKNLQENIEWQRKMMSTQLLFMKTTYKGRKESE